MTDVAGKREGFSETACKPHCAQSRKDALAAAEHCKASPHRVSLLEAMKKAKLDKVYIPCAKTGKLVSIAEVLRDL